MLDKRRDKKQRRAEKRAAAEEKEKEDDNIDEEEEEDDLDDFSSDYKLMKRLKKGKISQDEFDSAFDVDSIEQDT